MKFGLVVFTAFWVTVCYGQQTHQITLNSNQPPLLEANAGGDLLLSENTSVQLGGSPAGTGGTPPYTYEWTPIDDLTNAGNSNPGFTSLTASRVYTLVVTDFNNCVAQDEISVTLVPLSVNEIDGIKVFPAVATEFISINAESRVEKVVIHDEQGKRVISELAGQADYRLNVTMLNPGLYILKVKTSGGWSTYKIIVK